MVRLVQAFCCALLLFAWQANAQEQDGPFHPLDALTAAEITAVKELLVASGRVTAEAQFANLTLDQPAKETVRRWREGEALERKAFVVVQQDRQTYEARVDLAKREIVSFARIEGVEASILNDEWRAARDAFMADPRFVAALKRRGFSDAKQVFCTPNPGAYFAEGAYAGRRIFRIPCFDRGRKLHPLVARPVENLHGIVDAETREVLSIKDGDPVALPDPPPGYGTSLPKPGPRQNPVVIALPNGPNISIRNNLEVAWLNWRFHVSSDRRAGVILSLVDFVDAAKVRPVAYQMHVSEVFVPYMDPDPNWAARVFLDAGEFGLGYLMSSLEPGIDCPDTAVFADFTFPGDDGDPYDLPRALCIFERPTGDPAWRHYSSSQEKVTGVAQVELVVRSATTVGNYDYVIDYVFTPQGNITLRVGATGYDAVKSVSSASMDDPTARTDTEYGSLIAPYAVAPFHDHYINFRIDLDVDGPANAVALDQFIPENIQSARKSIWKLQTRIEKSEGALSPHHGANIRILNQKTFNRLKQNPGYWISTHHQATSILDGGDWAQKRAAFSAATHWFTRYNPAERWAAGDYPNQSSIKLGLPDYVAGEETIENEDIVLWYTLGFRHVTRPEDFPILPTFWHDVTLRPAFFFDMDPSMTFNPGIPEEPQ